MAFDIKPSTHIANWATGTPVGNPAVDTVVSFPIASFPEMTAAEAAAEGTGDIRKVMLAMLDKFYSIYNGATEKPVKMQVYRNTSLNDVTGVATRTYTFAFTVDGTYEVTAEA